jgi:hypothetical protein
MGRHVVTKGQKQDRYQQLMDASESGVYPKKILDHFGSDHNAAAIWGNNNLDLKIPTNDDIDKKIREDLRIVEKSYEETMARATTGQHVAAFAGQAIPEILNPYLLPSYFIGYGEAAIAGRFLKGFGRVILAEAAIETAYQVDKYHWMNRVSEMSPGEAVLNIALVTGLTAGIGVTAAGLSRGMKRLLRKSNARQIEQLGNDWALHKFTQAADELARADDLVIRGTRFIRAGLEAFEERFKFRPKIRIYDTFEDIPERLKKQYAERIAEAKKSGIPIAAEGTAVTGFWTKGTFNVVAANITSAKGALGTIFHEAIGHSYFRTVPTKQIDSIYRQFKNNIESLARRKGISTKTKAGRRKATEEYAVIKLTKNIESATAKKITAEMGEVFKKKGKVRFLNRIARELGISDEDFKTILKDMGIPSLKEATPVKLAQVYTLFRQAGYAPKRTKAVDAIKGLQAEDKYQNVTRPRAQVRNVTQVSDVDDEVLDAGFEQIIKENPDLTIPERVELTAAGEEIIERKATDILDELDARVELANKYKECIIG